MKQHALRISDELMIEVDKRAQQVGLSRNEWLNRAVKWVLEQPIRTTTKKEKL